jgi:hypothetical protein
MACDCASAVTLALWILDYCFFSSLIFHFYTGSIVTFYYSHYLKVTVPSDEKTLLQDVGILWLNVV